MSKNSKNSQQQNKKEETMIVVNQWGEEIKAEDALTLNFPRVLATKKAAPPMLQGPLQGILNTMREHPANFAVERPDCEKAEQLTMLIEGINLRLKREQKPYPLWIPYLNALASWQEKVAPNKPADNTPTAIEQVEEKVEQARLEKRKQIEQQAAAAQALAALVPESIRKQQAEQQAVAEIEAKKREKAREKMLPFVLGHACVDQNSRPNALAYNGKTLGLLSFFSLRDAMREHGITDAGLVTCECAFCGAEHKLNATEKVSRRNRETGEFEEMEVFLVRQIGVPARTEDGSEDYCHRYGDREGQPRKLNVLVCRNCGSTAHHETKNEVSNYKVWPQDLYPKFATWMAKQDETLASEGLLQQSAGNTLSATLAERNAG